MDSTTGGYLLPSDDFPPSADAPLEDALQFMISSLTGLPSELVRQRWPTVVSEPPGPDTDWCAFGVEQVEADGGPLIRHRPAPDASARVESTVVQTASDPTRASSLVEQQELIRHESFIVVASFHGPSAQRYATQLRDGVAVPQANETLRPYRLAVVRAGQLSGSADLVDNTWLRRFDLSIDMRHEVVRTYPIRNLSSAPVALNKD